MASYICTNSMDENTVTRVYMYADVPTKISIIDAISHSNCLTDYIKTLLKQKEAAESCLDAVERMFVDTSLAYNELLIINQDLTDRLFRNDFLYK